MDNTYQRRPLGPALDEASATALTAIAAATACRDGNGARADVSFVRRVAEGLVLFDGDGELIVVVRGEPVRRLGRRDRCAWCAKSEYHVCRNIILRETWTYTCELDA